MLMSRKNQILYQIAKYRILTSQQAAILFGLQSRSIRRILGDYAKSGSINIIPSPYSGDRGRPEHLYCLSQRGIEILKKEEIFDKELPPNRILWEGRQSLDHQISLNWFLVATEMIKTKSNLMVESISQTSPMASVGLDGKSFLYEEFEDDTSGNLISFIPDAVFAIQSPESGKASLFYVEIDRSTESLAGSLSKKNTIRNKILNYKFLFQKGVYGKYVDLFNARFKGFRTLFVCDSENRRSRILKVLEEQKPSNFVWITTLSQILQRGIGSKIWWHTGDHKNQPESILGQSFEFECPLLHQTKNRPKNVRF